MKNPIVIFYVFKFPVRGKNINKYLINLRGLKTSKLISNIFWVCYFLVYQNMTLAPKKIFLTLPQNANMTGAICNEMVTNVRILEKRQVNS